MKSFIIVAPVGENINDLFIPFSAVPPESVILISPKEHFNLAESTRKKLERDGIRTKIMAVKGNIWEEIFRIVRELKQAYPEERIVVNTATGDRNSSCAATSAAFVNGLKAVSVDGKNPMLLPVLKFDYYRIISEKKMRILKVLEERGGSMSFEELSRALKISAPLLSYYINGNLKTEGLKELGLVKDEDNAGKKNLKLTMLANMLLKGYIDKKRQ